MPKAEQSKTTKFQSTLPRGSDLRGMLSISRSINFNPRSLAGATCSPCSSLRSMNSFQSTLPRGSDRHSAKSAYLLLNFNPRSLAGATKERAAEERRCSISIHAPSRERLLVVYSCVPGHHFNPRSLAGATMPAQANMMIAQDFNPRSLAGATCHQ